MVDLRQGLPRGENMGWNLNSPGKIWKKTINRTELEDYQARYDVISSRLFAGNSVVHVLSDKQPEGFDPVEGGLEDVYFSTLSTLRRAA